MAEWGRETRWRQGQVLAVETARELDLVDSEARDAVAVVVISHDCDLAQSPGNEPDVEVIVGRVIDEANGNFTHAKNVRKLHLSFERNAGPVVVELLATAKAFISKEALLNHTPQTDLRLAPNALSILQRWLAARYRRAAFPDEFDRRLEDTGMKDQLTKILKPSGMHIPAIFFDVDQGEEVTRDGPDDPYTLDIYLLHVTTPDPAVAEAAANAARDQIEKAFKAKLYIDNTGWQHIELGNCTVISDESMTYAQSRILKEWRLEYISLRAEPPQTIMET